MARSSTVFIIIFCIVSQMVGIGACPCRAATKISIREVQTILKALGYYAGPVDGINGPITRNAIKAFQSKNKLAADGIVGPLTTQALLSAQAAVKKPANTTNHRILSTQGVRLENFAPKSPNRIALTFDDGPDPETTPEILRLLRERRLKATFFVIGIKCERYPDLVREIVSEGHSVQNHSYTHGPAEGLGELNKAQQLIRQLTGSEPAYFRPPGGRIPPHTLAALSKLGLSVAYWSNIGEGYTLFPGAVLRFNETKDLLTKLPEVLDQVVEADYDATLLDKED
ncbi:MAG TPA: polysaccharide deacetylase family protein [Firmicutes bacterium]|nr:polysaccharide deacetylase family protein [Bacillota bacterium]